MTSTIIQQGRFTSDGTSKTLNLRSDVDWMEVYNVSVAANDTQTTAIGVEYYWQKGMPAGSAWEYKKSDAANAAQLSTFVTTGGFTPSGQGSQGGPVTGTTITKAFPAVCTATGHGYSNGDLVILSNLTEMPQLAQIVFSIANVTANTFELTYMDTTGANFTAETAFTVRSLTGSPAWRQAVGDITNIVAGSTTDVVISQSGQFYGVGDVMRFIVPEAMGMSELNGLQGTILSINTTTNTYTVDIDSSGFTPFSFPPATSVPFTFAQMQPVGTISASSATDASKNLATLSMTLGAGVDGSAGQNGNIIYWKAGKSFSVNNE